MVSLGLNELTLYVLNCFKKSVFLHFAWFLGIDFMQVHVLDIISGGSPQFCLSYIIKIVAADGHAGSQDINGLNHLEIFMFTAMLVNQNFPSWLLIGWQHSCQPIRSHVCKSCKLKWILTWLFLVIQAPGHRNGKKDTPAVHQQWTSSWEVNIGLNLRVS